MARAPWCSPEFYLEPAVPVAAAASSVLSRGSKPHERSEQAVELGNTERFA